MTQRLMNQTVATGVAVLLGLALMPAPAPAQERPETTTIHGDTGLWFLPTADTLPAGRWSASAYRVDYDREQGFTDISHFIGTFGIGAGDRIELFGSMQAVTRIDRDIRPLLNGSGAGGLVHDFPLATRSWTGNAVGDLYLGGKLNLMAEHRGQPLGLGVRGMVKVPTGDDEVGASTGKTDVRVDLIGSKESHQVQFTSTAGVILRGDPAGLELPNSVTWGVGVAVPSRRTLRVYGELRGEEPLDDAVVASGSNAAVPPLSLLERTVDASIGLQWQHRNGFFVGAGLNWAVTLDERSAFGAFRNAGGDRIGLQVRLGFHPGVRIPAPPAAPPPPPRAAAPAPVHTLTVRAECDPCTIETAATTMVTAVAQSSIGCSLTYRWSAPSGTFANATARQTTWTAPAQAGSVPLTVTAACSQDNRMASDTVTVQVTSPPARSYVFEDVHFDFDRYTLRVEATRALEEAVTALQADRTLRLEVQGHTCNIGTAEYNLALGDRRANSVRDYLVSRGIAAERVRTVSYGEEQPAHNNGREETRRLNRRAVLVAQLVR